jgi:RIO-like serine/threonine protein kinase
VTPHAQRPASEPAPFTRGEIERAPPEVLSCGRWANAVLRLYRHGGECWVVKDFRPRAFAVRNTIGRLLIRRELRALRRLAGLAGVPARAFRLDAHALAYVFVPGVPLYRADLGQRAAGFFSRLERLVGEMHAVGGIVHLEVRNGRNVLVSEQGEPVLLDFQAHVGTRWMPGGMRRWAERFDVAGVYKHWAQRSPDTLGEERARLLAWATRWRRRWVLRGYFGIRKPGRGAGASDLGPG